MSVSPPACFSLWDTEAKHRAHSSTRRSSMALCNGDSKVSGACFSSAARGVRAPVVGSPPETNHGLPCVHLRGRGRGKVRRAWPVVWHLSPRRSGVFVCVCMRARARLCIYACVPVATCYSDRLTSPVERQQTRLACETFQTSPS